MSFQFAREFFRSPSTIGALWPSSDELASLMVRAARLDNARHVLELGPGNGAVTRTILASLPADARFLAIEKNLTLAEETSAKFPDARIVAGCATRLGEHLREHDFPAPDSVLSGLPWASFPPTLQRDILAEVASAIHEETVFTTFAYFGPHWLPAGRRFRKFLEEFFGRVERTRVVLANIPPAFVYVCKRGAGAAA